MGFSIKGNAINFRSIVALFAFVAMMIFIAADLSAQKGSKGGGSLDSGSTTAAKGGGGSGGGGGGGGGGGTPSPTPTPTPVNPLPTTAPAPGVILRESFGPAELWRPTGGKGTMKETYTHTPISSYWLEYPGSKDTQWIAPAEGQTWRFCAASDNPYEMFSPLQMTYANGCVASEWFDEPTVNPTALQNFVQPSTAYELTLNGWPAPIPGKYLALGLTNNGATYSNLENTGSLVLFLKPAPPYMNYTILYELRAGGLNGTLLASGETYFEGWNQMKLRYDPVTQTVSGSVNGTEFGSFVQPIDAPRYVGFEGIAIADNFVVTVLNQ